MLDLSRTVGRYEVLGEIGRGGMAVVYLARQTDLDRFVALKQLVPAGPSDPTFGKRFVREARVAAELSHPNIVTVHEYFEHDGTPYIAMEYVPRGSLRPWIGRMSLAQIAGVLEGILAGLAHGEEHGIVHRDLKPENVMVTAEGRVKIADYGIAKATNQLRGSSAMLTAVGTTVGTPAYMAPEQAMAQPVGPATDLYSVGCMAYEFFTGAPPFHETEAPTALLLRHVNEPIPPAASVDPSIDPAISDWIDRLLVKDPRARTASGMKAWDEFEEIAIRLLGPRWRRAARLADDTADAGTPVPLTPAPFDATARTETPAEPTAAAPLEPPAFDSGPIVASGFVTFVPPAPSRPPVEEDTEDLSPVARSVVPTPPPEPALEPPPAPVPPPPPEPEPEPTPPPAPFASSAQPDVGVEPARTLAPHLPLPGSAAAAERSRGTSHRLLIVAAIAVAAIVAGAVLLGGGGKTPVPGPIATVRLSSGPLAATLPAGWRAVSPAPVVAGLDLRAPAAGAPRGDRAAGTVVVGVADAASDSPALLPRKLRAAAAPGRAIARLRDGIEAYRYTVGTSRPMTLYVVPTSAGVATIACLPPAAGAAAFDSACARLATTLAVSGKRVYPLGPSSRYATAIDRAMGPLSTMRAALRSAESRKLQAAAATRTARAYAGAAGALSRLSLSPADRTLNTHLAGALERTGTAFAAMARSARKDRPAAYRRAAKIARQRERSVREALAAIASAGYAKLLATKLEPVTIPDLKAEQRSPGATPSPAPTPSATAAPTATAQPQQPQPTPYTPPSTGGGGGSGGAGSNGGGGSGIGEG